MPMGRRTEALRALSEKPAGLQKGTSGFAEDGESTAGKESVMRSESEMPFSHSPCRVIQYVLFRVARIVRTFA